MLHGQHEGYTMTDEDIKKLRRHTRQMACDMISLDRGIDTPPEQRIDEAMRGDGEVFLECATTVVSLISPARVTKNLKIQR